MVGADRSKLERKKLCVILCPVYLRIVLNKLYSKLTILHLSLHFFVAKILAINSIFGGGWKKFFGGAKPLWGGGLINILGGCAPPAPHQKIRPWSDYRPDDLLPFLTCTVPCITEFFIG